MKFLFMANNKIETVIRRIISRLTQRYITTVRRESNEKIAWEGKITRLYIIVNILLYTVIVGGVFFALFAWTPLHNILPGYLHSNTRAEIINNTLKVDSLTREMELRDRYIENIASILNGEITIDSIARDTVMTNDSTLIWSNDILTYSSAQSDSFSQQYEQKEQFNLTMLPPPVEGVLFHKPLSGTIVSTFNLKENRPRIEIQTARNTSAAAVLDGTIISIINTISDGYVITLQHNNNYVSIYRNIGECLRKVGDKVIAGERIGIVGTALNDLAGFELWHQGMAIDPQLYIVF